MMDVQLPKPHHIDAAIDAEWFIHENGQYPLLRIGGAKKIAGYRLTASEATALAQYILATVADVERFDAR